MSDQPVALVTGGSSDIGRAICVSLAREGFAVLVNYKDDIGSAERTLAAIEQAGGRAEVCQGDITAPSHRELLLGFCMENLRRLDVLVNSAAIRSPGSVDLLEATDKDYNAVLSMNLKAAFFLTQAVARLMIQQITDKVIPSGAIINLSSVNACTPSTDQAAYCISKAGLSMVTRLFAARLAQYGINVYEIRRGLIATDVPADVKKACDRRIKQGISPIRRWGRPEDVGQAVAMLARGDLPFSTGEVINVDGGFHFKEL